jgi:hypothetical protein
MGDISFFDSTVNFCAFSDSDILIENESLKIRITMLEAENRSLVERINCLNYKMTEINSTRTTSRKTLKEITSNRMIFLNEYLFKFLNTYYEPCEVKRNTPFADKIPYYSFEKEFSNFIKSHFKPSEGRKISRISFVDKDFIKDKLEENGLILKRTKNRKVITGIRKKKI